MPNTSGYALDLIFSNVEGISVAAAIDTLVVCDSHHPALSISLLRRCDGCASKATKLFKRFYSANYDCINDFLAGVDWDKVLSDVPINDAVQLTYDYLNQAIESFVPSYYKRITIYPAWFSHELISLTKAKKRAHLCFKGSFSYADYLVFSELRSRCKALARTCWTGYVNGFDSAISRNPKSFWNFVNAMRSDNRLPNSVTYGDEVFGDSGSIACAFGNFFESVYAPIKTINSDYNYEDAVAVSSLKISISEVFESIQSLSLGSGAGVDGIPPVFFKNCKFILFRILWLLFAKSLACGVFPTS